MDKWEEGKGNARPGTISPNKFPTNFHFGQFHFIFGRYGHFHFGFAPWPFKSEYSNFAIGSGFIPRTKYCIGTNSSKIAQSKTIQSDKIYLIFTIFSIFKTVNCCQFHVSIHLEIARLLFWQIHYNSTFFGVQIFCGREGGRK
jgi:hypothetical protein